MALPVPADLKPRPVYRDREPTLDDLFPRGPGNWRLEDLNFRCIGLLLKAHQEVLGVQEVVLHSAIKGDQFTIPLPGWGVRINYIAWYSTRDKHGVLWDCTYNRGEPLEFEMSAGTVYRGLMDAVSRMSLGEKALAYIPPSLGYGARGFPALVPPHAHLIVWICLEHVSPRKERSNLPGMVQRCVHCAKVHHDKHQRLHASLEPKPVPHFLHRRRDPMRATPELY